MGEAARDTLALVRDADGEVERAVLAAILLDNRTADDVFQVLRPEDFHDDRHRHLAGAMRSLYEHGEAVDPLTVRDRLDREQHLKAAGGMEYIAELLDMVPTAANARDHAEVVRTRALERALVRAGQDIVATARARQAGARELVAAAERALGAAVDRTLVDEPRVLGDIVWEVSSELENRHAHPQRLLGIGTGLMDLDELVAGWRPGQYVLVGARPSEGKTALALKLAREAAGQGFPVLFLSLEMTAHELAERLLASEAEVNSRDMARGRLATSDWPHLAEAAGKLATLPVYIVDSAATTVSQIRAVARRYQRQHGVKLVVLDYVQLVHPDRRTESAVQDMRDISGALKSLAKELLVPVVALSQLNRQVEGRSDTKPKLSDLRESGALEQDADVVVLLWTDPKKAHDLGPRAPLTLLVVKQRNGPKGECEALFDRPSGRFLNYRGEGP
jgi:replicative DNA helicase